MIHGLVIKISILSVYHSSIFSHPREISEAMQDSNAGIPLSSHTVDVKQYKLCFSGESNVTVSPFKQTYDIADQRKLRSGKKSSESFVCIEINKYVRGYT